MGWWQTEGGDLLGDLPADGITEALQDIADAAILARQSKPTLSAVIGALAAVYCDREFDYLEKGHSKLSGTIMLRGKPIIKVCEKQFDVCPNIVTRLHPAIDQIAQVYIETVERKPSLNELLATLTFVLSVDPEKYVCDTGIQPLRSGDLIFKSK